MEAHLALFLKKTLVCHSTGGGISARNILPSPGLTEIVSPLRAFHLAFCRLHTNDAFHGTGSSRKSCVLLYHREPCAAV